MQPGSIWVEGSELHHIDEDGNEWKLTGEDQGSITGQKGSIWIENDKFYYVDEDNHKRECPKDNLSSTSGISGSAWIEGNYIHFLDTDQYNIQMWRDWDDRVTSGNSKYYYYSYHSDSHDDEIGVSYFMHTDEQQSSHSDYTYSGGYICEYYGDHSEWRDNCYYVDSVHEDVTYLDGHNDHNDHEDAGHSDHSDDYNSASIHSDDWDDWNDWKDEPEQV